jgi:predicted  nucleic acid-binding Zn-ribbon protein
MRVRHKIPSVFSLSMVDVLCCALGCVILLWLLGAKQTEDETSQLRDQALADREQSAKMLASAQDASAKLDQRLRGLLIDRDRAVALEARLAMRIADLERTRDLLGAHLSDEKTRAGDLEKRLKTSLARAQKLETEVMAGSASLDSERKKLDSERKKAGALDKKLAAAESALKATRADLDSEKNRSTVAQRQLSDLNREIDARKRELSALNRTLSDAEAARKKLEGTLAVRDKELEATRRESAVRDKALEATKREAKERLDASAARERSLEEQLRDRAAAIDGATRAYETLKVEAASLRSTKDGRFAGINLTGRRVVFLVDMSGSMEMVDEKTPAPEKWKEVCTTVGRLMRSLSHLEKYQVICFSTKLLYPLGDEGKWRDHDPLKSPQQVVKALGAVKPKAGTNMYLALEAAFKYRADKLDTVYLLSDGLPNHGEGVSDKQDRELSEIERGQLLGRHVRRKLKEQWNKPTGRSERVKINTIGFFFESPDLGSFLWALARENDGSFVGMSKP